MKQHVTAVGILSEKKAQTYNPITVPHSTITLEVEVTSILQQIYDLGVVRGIRWHFKKDFITDEERAAIWEVLKRDAAEIIEKVHNAQIKEDDGRETG